MMVQTEARYFGMISNDYTDRGAERSKRMGNSREETVRKALLENYGNYYRLAYSYTHREADAMDIVQEGAYRAMLKANTLREEGLAETWIYRIMINAAKEHLRKYGTVYEELDADHISGKDCPDLELRAVVDGLPMHERTLIILRFYEDKTLDEMADILRLNVNTVKSRLYRTLEKLRRELT